MCSHYFLNKKKKKKKKKKMDNYQGDLTDIIRATGATPPAETPIAAAAAAPEWQFPTNPITFSTCPVDDFGDPFAHLRDPLIDSAQQPPLPGFFHSSDMVKATTISEAVGFVGSNHKILDDELKRPPNIFSRMLQISPTAKLPLPPCDSPAAAASPTGLKRGPTMLDHTLISPINSKGCLVESSSLQISSPRTAPAPANSRPSGEIVPSDLWAWRKYGQKPIKGSPYPRGYYRCSSSKGCSARKQVERSRTDPNMLVITYTSEHNHPWPTQRNALAGSTRAQPSKTGKTSSPNSTTPKEEHKETSTSTENAAPSSNSAAVKEEADQEFDNINSLEMADDDAEFGDGFSQTYKPTLQSEDSFFAGLGEIETDSLDLMFTQGFDHGRDTKALNLDPFSFYDWGGSNAASGGEDEGKS